MELYIKNIRIIDGSGDSAYRANIGIEKGKLRIFRNSTDYSAETVLDGTGLTAVPGFIDAHSHGDLNMSSDYPAASKITQGITCQVAGQCGFSMFPANPSPESFSDFQSFIQRVSPYPDFPQDKNCCESAASFQNWIHSLENPVSTFSFVGHGSLRIWAMGYANRKPDKTELARMQKKLRQCMREGAIGLSTGLVYAPICYADNEEILALLNVVKDEGGFFSCHPRNESDTVIEARLESIRLAKKAGVPLCISHMKAAGHDNWGKPRVFLEEVNRALDSGAKLLMDTYPYMAGCTALNVSIPPRYFTNGMDGLIEALQNPSECKLIEKELQEKNATYENFVYNCNGYDGVFISSCPFFHDAEGMRLTEYAAKTNQSPFDAYREILIKNHGQGLAIYFHMCEDDVLAVLEHPICSVGTDGLIGKPGENPHPRVFGTMPKAFRMLTQEHRILTEEQAIYKMTGLPASFLGLSGKGFLRDGYDADILLLRMDEFKDTASYTNGSSLTEGIEYVIKSGKIVDMERYRVFQNE